jgi:hypothetical protein
MSRPTSTPVRLHAVRVIGGRLGRGTTTSLWVPCRPQPGLSCSSVSTARCARVSRPAHSHARTHACTRTHANTRTHARTRASARTHARTHADAGTHARTHARTRARTFPKGRCRALPASTARFFRLSSGCRLPVSRLSPPHTSLTRLSCLHHTLPSPVLSPSRPSLACPICF